MIDVGVYVTIEDYFDLHHLDCVEWVRRYDSPCECRRRQSGSVEHLGRGEIVLVIPLGITGQCAPDRAALHSAIIVGSAGARLITTHQESYYHDYFSPR